MEGDTMEVDIVEVTRMIQNKILTGYGVNFMYSKNIATEIASMLADEETQVADVAEFIYKTYNGYPYQTAEHVAKLIVTAIR